MLRGGSVGVWIVRVNVSGVLDFRRSWTRTKIRTRNSGKL